MDLEALTSISSLFSLKNVKSKSFLDSNFSSNFEKIHIFSKRDEIKEKNSELFYIKLEKFLQNFLNLNEPNGLRLSAIPDFELVENYNNYEYLFFWNGFYAYNRKELEDISIIFEHKKHWIEGIVIDEALKLLNIINNLNFKWSLTNLIINFSSFLLLDNRLIYQIENLLKRIEFLNLKKFKLALEIANLEQSNLNDLLVLIKNKIKYEKVNLESFSFLINSLQIQNESLNIICDILQDQENLEEISIYIGKTDSELDLTHFSQIISKQKYLKEFNFGMNNYFSNEFNESNFNCLFLSLCNCSFLNSLSFCFINLNILRTLPILYNLKLDYLYIYVSNILEENDDINDNLKNYKNILISQLKEKNKKIELNAFILI